MNIGDFIGHNKFRNREDNINNVLYNPVRKKNQLKLIYS